MQSIDEIDLKILDYLQENARIKRSEIAEKINLSLPSVADRMNKLEELGFIEKYLTKLNHKKLGNDITAYIFVTSDSSTYYKDFIQHTQNLREILECHAITGDGSHILKIRTENTSSLEKLLAKIQSWKGVSSTRTSIVLSTHKETSAISLKHFLK
ncbi:MAG: Lrp/AsnC family transcriptional regulator [Ignavibacteria bacterium]|nr:Lrp/AsnC family transcriptional regulator [Ignavibacteria bacterium]